MGPAKAVMVPVGTELQVPFSSAVSNALISAANWFIIETIPKALPAAAPAFAIVSVAATVGRFNILEGNILRSKTSVGDCHGSGLLPYMYKIQGCIRRARDYSVRNS